MREECVVVAEREGAGRFGQRLDLVDVRAVDGDDLHAVNRLRGAHVRAADPARADDPDSHAVAGYFSFWISILRYHTASP